MRLFLSIFAVLFSILLEGQTPFEKNIMIGAFNEIKCIEPMGENFLVQIKATDPLFEQYEYRCYNAQGDELWRLDSGFQFGGHALPCVREDGSAVLFIFDYGCDFASNMFQIMIISNGGDVIQNFVFDDMTTSPLIADSEFDTFLKTQNELVVLTFSGFQIFDLSQGTLSSEYFLDPMAMPLGGLRINDDKIALYDAQGIIQHDFISGQNYFFLFPMVTTSVSLHGDELFAMGLNQIAKFDLTGMATGVHYLDQTEGSYLPHVTWNSNVLMTVVSNPNGWEKAKIYSEVLNELGSFDIVDSHLYTINCFTNAGEEYWIGGRNNSVDSSGSRALLKSYPFFSEPWMSQQDIGVTNIEFGNVYFTPMQNPLPGTTIHYLIADVLVTVTNFSEVEVADWSIHNHLVVYLPPWCSQAVSYGIGSETIGVAESKTYLMMNTPLGYHYNLEDQEEVPYSLCVSSLGPNNLLDDFPDNDSFCAEGTTIFTEVDNLETLPFSYRIKSDGVEINSTAPISYVLIDMQGKIIESANKGIGVQTIGTDHFASGIYALSISTDSSRQTIRFSK